MCGLAGLVAPGRPAEVLRPVAEAMGATLVHRGPDAAGHVVRDGVGLAFRRLSIIDLAAGHQPMTSDDGRVVLTFNGEVYNYRELRAELAALGHRFLTNSDTEVVLRAYLQWGDDALPRLNGMFAIALWDERTRRVLLARDPAGIKPLYTCRDRGVFYWASELRAIRAVRGREDGSLDADALLLYFALRHVPSPRTIVSGIEKLRPGHLLDVRHDGTVHERRFAAAPADPTTSIAPRERSHGELARRIEAAVVRQMVSDVPIGSLLSGGVDSTIVTAIAQAHAARPLDTFTVGFDVEDVDNELVAAAATARLLGTRHHEVVLGARDYWTMLCAAQVSVEEPVSSVSAPLMLAVCTEARRHVTVVLTGQGADEPFGGYRRYVAERYGGTYRALPRFLDAVVGMVGRARRRPDGAIARALRTVRNPAPSQRFVEAVAVFDVARRAPLLGVDARHAADVAEAAFEFWRADVAERHPLEQLAYVEVRTTLADEFLLYGDKTSMAASVEARVPLLDLELLTHAEALPAATRVRGLTGKHLYRRAVSRWVPRHVGIGRKRGFGAPLARWYRRELADAVRETLLAEHGAVAMACDRAIVRRLLDEHQRDGIDHTRALHSLVVFALWHEHVLRRPTRADVGWAA